MSERKLFRVVETVQTTYLVRAASAERAKVAVSTKTASDSWLNLEQVYNCEVSPVGLWNGEVQ